MTTTAPAAVRSAMPSWVHRVPAYAGITVCVLGALILLGWSRHFASLANDLPALPTTKANSALALAVAGVSLAGKARGMRWLALLPLAVGALTLLEWVTGNGIGIDQLLVHDGFTTEEPGRPSPQTATALVLFAVARLLSGSSRPRTQAAGGVATTVFACAALVLELGWVFQAPELTAADGGNGISAVSALCVGLLAVGLAALHAQRRPLVFLWDTGLTGTVVRRLLPTVLLAPPLLGLLRLLGEDLGWYGLHLGTALFAGSMMLLMAVVVTVTGQSIHRLEAERTRITRELEAIFDSVPAAMTMRDPQGRLVRSNGALAPPRLRADADELAAQEAAALHEQRPVTRAYGPTGDGREYEITKFPVYDADGSALGIGGFALDVTARLRAERALREAEQRARQLAERDPLTGIWNRRWFEAELGSVLEHLPAEEPAGALLVVDVDHFKTVNDTAGHHVGDQLLVTVAQALTRTVGSDGSVSRIGGDEFAVVLRRGDRAAVERTADRIVRTVAESAAACDLGPVAGAVSASIGVALFADLTPRERTERDALVRADEALYAAKRGGRGRHLRYTPELARRA